MSNMLEQAIMDAETLREAALKNRPLITVALRYLPPAASTPTSRSLGTRRVVTPQCWR